MEALKVLNNRYQLLSVIKKGGFGTIYKGYDSVLGKDIAVKEINQALLEDSWYTEQFQNEARHVAKLNHQNIVHIFDLVETSDSQFYIVMEYIDGVDLSYLLKDCKFNGRPIPQHVAVHIVAEICKALDYAHSCRHPESNEPLNLVHQDISPGNIMISKSGVIKLIDFGIAGVQKERFDDADTITLQGKIQYMSPEHVSTERELDKRSDIFSLGLVLYELLESHRFFHGDDTQTIVETLRNGKLKVKHSSHTPKPLQKILAKSLEKAPEKRFQNANQFYIDLVTYLVMHHDASTIDSELVGFIKGVINEMDPVEIFNGLDIKESDLLLDMGPEDTNDEGHANGTKDITALSTLDDNFSEKHKSLPPVGDFEPGQTQTSSQMPADYFEAGDEIKTVIDVVRLSTRGHKKLILRGLFATLTLCILVFLADIAFQWTSLGTGVYDFLFPPAIKIASIPDGAEVFLNDKQISGKTPLGIDKIEPGIYELKLTLPPYLPIVKSIYIPGKGKVQIKGEEVRNGNKPYLFRFKTTLEIESTPDDATIYINGIRYGQNTPCSVTWEVGQRFDLRLEKAGFNNLTGFTINEQLLEEIEDHRLWSLDVETESTLVHRIKGLFGKHVTINSQPEGAAIYLDNNPNPIGYTGKEIPLFLTAATHNVVLKKKNYNPRTLKIKIDKDAPASFFATLTRPVSFRAREITDGQKGDIRATLKKLMRGNRTISSGKKTPFKLNLGPQKHLAIFSKPGYEDLEMEISPTTNLVTAEMTPSAGQFSIVILERETRKPISNVEVRYNAMDEGASMQESVDITDIDGTVSGSLQPGIYIFRTSKNGFRYNEQTVLIEAGNLNQVEFALTRK